MKNQKMIAFLTALLLLLCSVCGIMIVANADAEEATPSITIDDLYRVVSPYMVKSDFPVDLMEIECIRIDLNTDVIPTGTVIDGEFFFPALPPALDLVFLYDGGHLVPALWHWTDENRIYVAFDAEDMSRLDSATGLYVFLFAYQQPPDDVDK